MTKTQKIIIICAAVIVAVGLIIGGVFLFKGDKPEPTPTPTPTPTETVTPTPTVEPTPTPTPTPAPSIEVISKEEITGILELPFVELGFDCTGVMTLSPEDVLELQAMKWYAFKFDPLYGQNIDIWMFDGGLYLTDKTQMAAGPEGTLVVESMPVKIVDGYNYVLVMPTVAGQETTATFNSYAFEDGSKVTATDTVIKINTN